jgi:hypothetical protein
VGEIMTLQAAAVEVLVEKAKFEPAVAVGIAQAIEVSCVQAQYVTVPILDVKVQELKTEIHVVESKLEAKLAVNQAQLVAHLEKVKAELMRWVLLVMLGSVALTAATTGLVKALP